LVAWPVELEVGISAFLSLVLKKVTGALQFAGPGGSKRIPNVAPTFTIVICQIYLFQLTVATLVATRI
jgi:hypothetical protein